jgi:hypothetical protein
VLPVVELVPPLVEDVDDVDDVVVVRPPAPVEPLVPPVPLMSFDRASSEPPRQHPRASGARIMVRMKSEDQREMRCFIDDRNAWVLVEKTINFAGRF